MSIYSHYYNCKSGDLFRGRRYLRLVDINGTERLNEKSAPENPVHMFPDDQFWDMDMNEVCGFIREVWGPGWYTPDFQTYIDDPEGEVHKTGTVKGQLRALTIHEWNRVKTIWLAINSPFWEMEITQARAFVETVFPNDWYWIDTDWSGIIKPEEVFGTIVKFNGEVLHPEYEHLQTYDEIPGMPGKCALVIEDTRGAGIRQLCIVDEEDAKEEYSRLYDELFYKYDRKWEIEILPEDPDDY